MLKRILVALVGIPFLLVTLFWPGGTPFAVVCAAIGLIGVLEMASALESSGRPVSAFWPLVGVGYLVLSYTSAPVGAYRFLGLAFLFLAMLTWETFRGVPRPFETVSTYLMMIFYPGLIVVPLILRYRDGTMLIGRGSYEVEIGAIWIAIALLFVWATDSGAYFVGRAIGKRKLAPHLSPGKTWEGAIGGWILAVLVGFGVGIWGRAILVPGGPAAGLLLGAVAGVWAQVGDLAESAMKREIGVKDFGGWLPGHGGVLDRFDSFLFICPLIYLWSLL